MLDSYAQAFFSSSDERRERREDREVRDVAAASRVGGRQHHKHEGEREQELGHEPASLAGRARLGEDVGGRGDGFDGPDEGCFFLEGESGKEKSKLSFSVPFSRKTEKME